MAVGNTNTKGKIVHLADVEFNENGVYIPNKDVTGFGKVTVNVENSSVLPEDYVITPTKEPEGTLEPVYDEYTEPFVSSEGEEFKAVDKIKVRQIGSWIDSEISADNIKLGRTILGVAGNVVELRGGSTTVKSTTREQTITPNSPNNAFTSVTVSPLNLETKTVQPSTEDRTLYAGSGYDAISRIDVKKVTSAIDENITPENIKHDVTILGVTGTFEPIVGDLTVTPKNEEQVFEAIDDELDGYKVVTVEKAPLENIVVTPKVTEQQLTASEEKIGFEKITVNPVTADIDKNIKSNNIKRGVEILGVTGTYTTENLQTKTVDPMFNMVQNVTFDPEYDGLSTVVVNAVTADIDEDIIAENIKKDVEILGVTGTYEGPQYNIEEKTVAPKTTAQTVTPSQGYDYLSKVNVEGVTSSIDENIKPENIAKDVTILGVLGTHEGGSVEVQDRKIITELDTLPLTIDPDEGFEALRQVIIESISSGIDPNLLAKNIKKNIRILGVTGTYEGEPQKWFDFNGTNGFNNLSTDVMGAGYWGKGYVGSAHADYSLENYFKDGYNGVTNVAASLFTKVMGYDKLNATNPITSQIYIFFNGGFYYVNDYVYTPMKNEICHLYPIDNEYGVNGCLLNSEDVAEEKTYGLWVFVDTTGATRAKPVLVSGDYSTSMRPEEYNQERYVGTITIPAHKVFIPKYDETGNLNWVMRDEDNVSYLTHENEDKPFSVDISAYDNDFGTVDNEEKLEGNFETGSHNEFGELTKTNYNFCKINTVNISEDGIASGFAAQNYLRLKEKFNPGDKTWLMQFKFKQDSIDNNWRDLIGACEADFSSGVHLYATSNGKISFELSSTNSGSWNITGTGGKASDVVITPGIWYWVRLEFTGSDYNCYLSENGVSFRLISNLHSSVTINALNAQAIGCGAWNNSATHALNGSIDLNECWIEIAGERWWTALLPTQSTYSNFSLNNYVTTDDVFINTQLPWEIQIPFCSPSSWQTTEYIFGQVGSNSIGAGMNIMFSRGTIQIAMTSNGTSWDICNGTYSFSPMTNKFYNMKIKFTGTQYLLATKGNGDWNADIVIANNSKPLLVTEPWTFGACYTNYLRGTIFFDDVYIKSDGQYWWKPFDYKNFIKSSHNLTSLQSNMLFVNREDRTTSEEGSPVKALRGCLVDYTDNGQGGTYGLYSVRDNQWNENTFVFAPNTNSFEEKGLTNIKKIRDVEIPPHRVGYEYNGDGTWTLSEE